jgi:hypothetical protein
VYDRIDIESKGFLNEKIRLIAEIGDDQIAKVDLYNSFMGNNVPISSNKVEINQLTYYYDISDLE